jgi:hypothetical protein
MPTIPLDVWISVSERLPWEGPVKLIYKNTLKELPCADAKVVLFTALSAVAHEMRADILRVLGNMAKMSINLGIIGPPASGKTAVPSCILSRLGIKCAGSRSSPEGISRILSEDGAVVHLCDEVQQIFRGRRRDEYVGALIDLWKSAFTKSPPLTMARRSPKKSVDIPSSAKLTVIWTATEDDLEKVSEVIDSALLRRFLILRTTARVDPLIEGVEGEWDEVKACIKFINSFKWRFYPEIDDNVRRFRDEAASMIKDFELSGMVLSEYGIKIACVLAIDRVVSDLLKEVRKRLRNSTFVTIDGVYDNLMQVFQEVVRKFNELVSRSSTTPSTTDDKTLNNSSTTDASKPLIVEDVYKRGHEVRGIYVADFSPSTGETLGWLKYVEVMHKVLLKFVETSVEGSSQGIEELINFMEKGVWRSPTFSSEDMDVIDVYVPQEYVILGITLTALALIDTSEFVKWFGWDENWLYFVRKCYELGEKFGEFNIRTMAMYMRRISRYSTIKEYVERALDAGFIEISKCEDIKNIARCWFRLSPSSSI